MSLELGRTDIFVAEKCNAPKLSLKIRYIFFGHPAYDYFVLIIRFYDTSVQYDVFFLGFTSVPAAACPGFEI